MLSADSLGILVTLLLLAAVGVAVFFGVRWMRRPETRGRGAFILLTILIHVLVAAVIMLVRI